MNNQEREEQISHLPGQILLALARNEAASLEWRKAAVKIMLENGFSEAKHPDIRIFLSQIKAEQDAKAEVEALVEGSVEETIEPELFEPGTTSRFHLSVEPPDENQGPLRASFTTKSQ